MKKFKKIIFTLIIFSSVILFYSCKRQDDWLNVKRLSGQVTPKTLADYQAILNFDVSLNPYFTTFGLAGTDNLYLTDTGFPTIGQSEQDAYLWKRSMWDDQGGVSYTWNNLFQIIEYANIVLDGLQNIDPKTAGYNNVKGQALFYRAIGYYNLSQLFCKPYDATTAAGDLGLPIRLSSDVNILYQRSSVQKTYDQILSDANGAASMLDDQPTLSNLRPYKYAALGLLSKIYLVMSDYANSGKYANDVLSNVSSLLDFNNGVISLNNPNRFLPNGLNNPEILFYASATDCTITRPYTFNAAFADPALYNSYNSNDLRKSYFYEQTGAYQQFRGGYTGDWTNFCGIATNEIFLIRAECLARQGNTAAAMNDLNALLKKRYITGTFAGLTASSSNAALALILQERRKELPFTANIRWEDLRRLNKDPNFQTTITHTINGTAYSLAPNDPKYVLPIPTNEVQISGLQQNPN